MKICFVADASSVLVQIWVSFFAKQGHEVTLISKCNANIPGAKVYAPKIFCSFKPFPNVVKAIFQNFLYYFYIVFKLREIKPEIINSIYLFPYGLYSVYSFCNAPQITSVFGSDILVLAKKYYLFRWLSKKIFNKSTLVQADSKEIMKWSLKFGCPKNKMLLLIIPGVDTKLFKRLQTRNPKLIISTRSLFPVYDVETTVRAFSVVLKKHPDTRLLVAGSGLLEEKLHQIASELGINNKITWLGKVKHEKLVEYLNKASIYISSSLSDSTSVSLLEAMSMSLAIVVSDVPANLEWIKHGYNGFVFKKKDYMAAAKYLIKFIENQKLASTFRKRSREIVLKNADYATNFRKFEEEFEKLIKQSRK